MNGEQSDTNVLVAIARLDTKMDNVEKSVEEIKGTIRDNANTDSTRRMPDGITAGGGLAGALSALYTAYVQLSGKG